MRDPDLVEAARDFLRKTPVLTPSAATFLAGQLPSDWAKLVQRYGHHAVFPLLATDTSLPDAEAELKKTYSMKDVRTHLIANDPRQLSADAKQALEAKLPANWKALINEYGYVRVFTCLRDNYTIGGARKVLRDNFG